MTDELGGRMRTIRFAPTMEAALVEMAEMRGISELDVIQEALSLYRWILRERAQGSRLLVQRGPDVTEWNLPGEPGLVEDEQDG